MEKLPSSENQTFEGAQATIERMKSETPKVEAGQLEVLKKHLAEMGFTGKLVETGIVESTN